MPSPSFRDRLKSFADKISGTSYVNNLADPTSPAYKMNQSVGKPNPNAPIYKKTKPAVQPGFKPTGPTSTGIGVGP